MTRDRELNDAYGLIADLKADNAALRERLALAKRALDWWDMDTLADALASKPEEDK